jgi:hypothetical protein
VQYEVIEENKVGIPEVSTAEQSESIRARAERETNFGKSLMGSADLSL